MMMMPFMMMIIFHYCCYCYSYYIWSYYYTVKDSYSGKKSCTKTYKESVSKRYWGLFTYYQKRKHVIIIIIVVVVVVIARYWNSIILIALVQTTNKQQRRYQNKKSRPYLLNGKFRVQTGERRFKAVGTTVWYSGADKKKEIIKIPGKTTDEVEVQVRRQVFSFHCFIVD